MPSPKHSFNSTVRHLRTGLLLLLLAVAVPSATFAQTLRLDCGGDGTYIDSLGRSWVSDVPYILETSLTGTFGDNSNPIGNTFEETLYQSERWFMTWVPGPHGYEIPVTTPGTYTIRMHFAEIYFQEVNKRTFDLFVNDSLEISALDLVATVGKNTAFIHEVEQTIPAGGGTIKITMTPGLDSPKFSAIEVILEGSAPAAPPVKTPVAPPVAAPVAAPTAAGFEIRINSGGPQIVDPSGNTWINDTPYLYAAQGDTWANGVPIVGTNNDALYQTERFFNRWTEPGLQYGYEIPVPTQGTYRVRVHFAVSWSSCLLLLSLQLLSGKGVTRIFPAVPLLTVPLSRSISSVVGNLPFLWYRHWKTQFRAHGWRFPGDSVLGSCSGGRSLHRVCARSRPSAHRLCQNTLPHGRGQRQGERSGNPRAGWRSAREQSRGTTFWTTTDSNQHG